VLIPTVLFWYRYFRNRKWGGPSAIMLGVLGLLVPTVLAIDFKIKEQQAEMEIINGKYINALNVKEVDVFDKRKPVLDETARTELRSFMKDLKVWQRPIHDAIILLTMKKKDPKATFFCAVVDLTYPGIEPVITPEYTEWKTLTSDLAREHDCLIAINGEAGDGIFQKSGYGEWVGNWVVEGRPITMLDTDTRPFLSFDKYAKASYSKASEVVTEPTEAMFNTIWGRWDLLIDGRTPMFEGKRAYSRTIMGIDRKGETLYLLIVDGKRHEYSLGLTMNESARLLLKMGAYNAMACDQGGSSCMYVEPLDGIINRPADNDGAERVVFTHFGIRIR